MIIQKSGDTAGMWIASVWINKFFYVAASMDKVDALNQLFEKLYWKLNLN